MTYERYNKPNLKDHRLDLHGLRKEEALRLLEKILFMKISEVNSKLGEKETREPYELNIVTGIGNHSKRVILRPAVKNFLVANGIEFKEFENEAGYTVYI